MVQVVVEYGPGAGVKLRLDQGMDVLSNMDWNVKSCNNSGEFKYELSTNWRTDLSVR